MPEILHQDMNVLTDESTVEIERSSPSSSLCAVADWLQSVSKLSKLQGIDLGEKSHSSRGYNENSRGYNETPVDIMKTPVDIMKTPVDIMKTPAIFMAYQNKIE